MGVGVAGDGGRWRRRAETGARGAAAAEERAVWGDASDDADGIAGGGGAAAVDDAGDAGGHCRGSRTSQGRLGRFLSLETLFLGVLLVRG